MEAHEVFLFLLIAAVSIFLLQKMVKSILTVAGITVFILFLYMVFSGQLSQFFNPPVKSVFQRHDVFFLYDNYCCDRCTNIERPVCSCIVLPVYEGILDRSTDEDLIEFEQNRNALRAVTNSILLQKQPQIDRCLENNQTTKYRIMEDIEDHIDLLKEHRNVNKKNRIRT